MKITIIGSDAYATSLANVLADNHHNVIIYTADEQQADEINLNHKNSYYLDNLKINNKIKATSSLLASLENTEILILCFLSDDLNATLEKIINYSKREMIVVNARPSLDQNLKSLSNKIINKLNDQKLLNKYAVIYAPNTASEIINRKPVSFMVSATSLDDAKIVKQLFENEYFKCLVSTDILSCEVAHSFDKIVSLSAGIYSELKLGLNATSNLIVILINEIYQLINKINGVELERTLNFVILSSFINKAFDVNCLEYKLGQAIVNYNKASTALDQLSYDLDKLEILKSIDKVSQMLETKNLFLNTLSKILYNNYRPITLLTKVFVAFGS
ncbi:NAD(P)-binding domain-containing protein [Mycoplasma putrefaciens]|uniref:Glycerol-3-phosphate dehydrogenase n=1 Tax=Mycoplasma putrefaciens Mput9231 TaxID=1292033 RepID=M9WGU6_9MOLU|nr:NAD(P)-binding domain-containing protein [Mycoplasma putrefaciens]AGJ90675.1 Glycerol-3-phosphate dehydrogenase [NAD(P)+] [Mycoplasma putrefaciens Mput9231]